MVDPTTPPPPSKGLYVTILVGLPGSGKMLYASNITIEGFPRIYMDNIRDDEIFLQTMHDGYSIIIADPVLCLTSARNITYRNIKAKGYLCSWNYFDNNLERCWANIVKRKEEKKYPYKLLKWLSSQYKIPTDTSMVRSVYIA